MKDLQDLFESLGYDEMKRLSDLIDKKSVNPKNVEKVMDYVAKVYCAEMGVSEAEISKEEMNKLIESFQLSCTLYMNILIGYMEIKSGRIKLTNDNCKFSLTKEGIEYVENVLKNNEL